MPVEQHYTIRAGTTSQSLLVYAADAGDMHAGKRGLTHDTTGAVAAFFREGAASATAVSLQPGRLGGWTSGGLAEVDAELLPGVYELGAPDELLAEGSTRALLLLRFPGAFIKPIEISLVAYDPQDAERMGVWGLANEKRHEFLRRALPRFTEMELALGEEAERRLTERLSPSKDA